MIVPTRRAADGSRVLALPKGHVDPGETAIEAAASEVREETGLAAEPVCELGESRYWYRRDGRTIGKTVAFFLFEYLEGDVADHDDEVEEVRWIGLRRRERSSRHAAEREMVTLARSPTSTKTDSLLPAMQVLNFYSTIFADELKRGRKTATIRLGDKSGKYRKNQAVLVTIGYQYSPRERIFEAVIDQVEVMKLARPLPARHQARQPRVPPPRGADQLPRTDLRPHGLAGGHRDGRALLPDHRQPERHDPGDQGLRRRPELSAPARARVRAGARAVASRSLALGTQAANRSFPAAPNLYILSVQLALSSRECQEGGSLPARGARAAGRTL